MSNAYVNRIATANPPHEVHRYFLRFAQGQLAADRRMQAVFARMSDKAGIERRFSYLAPAADPDGAAVDSAGVFRRGAFPGTAKRMLMYEKYAPRLAQRAVERLELGAGAGRITHLIVTSCTGFSAPGIDLELVERCGLSSSVERTMIGFMGCYAAINALKLARHVVRSEPEARVLVVNIELCTLHLQETTDLERLLSFCLWGDGCAATLVSADPQGFLLDTFRSLVIPETSELMKWSVGNSGFDMVLSGRVPTAVQAAISGHRDEILDGSPVEAFDLWAVHPGGKSVLDAVERALDLPPAALEPSREVLRAYGNMSSTTVMYVLKRLLEREHRGLRGCGMAFGPGLTAETMTFRTAA